MNKLIFTILFILFYQFSYAAFRSDSSHIKFLFGFDARNSFIKGHQAKIFGIKPGIQLFNKVRMGLGLYFLNPPIVKEGEIKGLSGQPIEGKAELRFAYLSTWAEYIIIHKPRWEISTPVHIGLGSIEVLYKPYNQSIIPSQKRASVVGYYKFFKWIGLGAGVGYRQMLSGKTLIRESFNSPIYMIKVKIFLGYLYKKYIRKKDVVE